MYIVHNYCVNSTSWLHQNVSTAYRPDIMIFTSWKAYDSCSYIFVGVDIIVMICLWWQMLEIGKTICIYWCLNVDRSCRWLVLVGWKITGALRLKILKPLGATIRRQSKISGEKFKNINNGKVLWLWLCDIGGYIVKFF